MLLASDLLSSLQGRGQEPRAGPDPAGHPDRADPADPADPGGWCTAPPLRV